MGYDDVIYKHLGGASKVEKYIAALWVHVQAYYCHPSLTSKVLVERMPGIKHYKGKDLSDRKLSKMKKETVNDLDGADLMLYMSGNCNRCSTGGGKAYKGSVCNSEDKYKQSICRYGRSQARTASTLAHEIGHNLGMRLILFTYSPHIQA